MLSECQLGAGTYDYTDDGRADDTGSRHRHRVELLIMRRFNRFVPWRDFELLRRSTRRVLLFKDLQGRLDPEHAELRWDWEDFMVPSTQMTGNDGLPEGLSVPSLLTHW